MMESVLVVLFVMCAVSTTVSGTSCRLCKHLSISDKDSATKKIWSNFMKSGGAWDPECWKDGETANNVNTTECGVDYDACASATVGGVSSRGTVGVECQMFIRYCAKVTQPIEGNTKTCATNVEMLGRTLDESHPATSAYDFVNLTGQMCFCQFEDNCNNAQLEEVKLGGDDGDDGDNGGSQGQHFLYFGVVLLIPLYGVFV